MCIRDSIEKQEKDFLSKEVDKISADIIKQFASKKIDAGRLNELKISVKNQVIYVAKCVDNGITIEINPPQEIEEPEEVKEGDNAETKKEKQQSLKNYEDKLKKVELIQKSMETVKNIGKLGLDIAKFLTFEGNDENPT